MRRLLLILISTFISFSLKGITIKSRQIGNWSDKTCWDLGRTPQHGDTVIIGARHSIALDIKTHILQNVTIEVRGILGLSKGKKLRLDHKGLLKVLSGGMLDGENGKSSLEINGRSIWNGNQGPVFGPIEANSNGLELKFKELPPLQLISFEPAAIDGPFIRLDWETSSELNNKRFIIEMSEDGGQYFSRIGSINGSGTKASKTQYSFDFIAQQPGILLFRLRQEDLYGNHYYSPAVKVKITSTSEELSLSTAEAQEYINNNPKILQDSQVSISDLEGKVLFRTSVDEYDFKRKILLPHLPSSGTYVVKITNSEGNEEQRFIVNR